MELKNINSLVELFFIKSEKNIPKKFSTNESTFLTNLKPKEIRRITGNQSFLERFGPNILRAAVYGFNPALGIGSLKARDVINLYDAFEAGKVSDEDISLGKLGITSLAKGGRVNYQDGTPLPYQEEFNQAKFNIEKGQPVKKGDLLIEIEAKF